MRTRMARTVVIAAALLVAVAFGASAQTVTGWEESLTGSVKAYALSQGVELKYVGLSQDQVPAEQWSKLTALANDPKFVSYIHASLRNILMGPGQTAYVTLGGKTFSVTSSGSAVDLSYTFTIN